MPRTILSTVGTSLTSNAAKEIGPEKSRDRQALARYLQEKPPQSASAETNALSRIIQPEDKLVFLHSHTDVGRLCAETLCGFFKKAGHQAEPLEITDLDYTESRFKMRGLLSLVAAMIRTINAERKAGREVIINATGGFKAEIAYATLVGLLFDVPVYYIHEAFKDIIAMPPTPIAWDMRLIDEHEEFFDWITQEMRTVREADQRLKTLPQEIHLLIEEEDGFCMLSPTGEAFFEAYRSHVEALPEGVVLLSSVARKTLAQADPNTQAVMRRTLRKMASPALRRTGSGQVHASDCMVYPKGHRKERIFYYELEDKVYVCELAGHEDQSYERQMEDGVCRNDYRDFEPYRELL